MEKLSFAYPEGKRPTLDRIDLVIREGEFLTLCGRSGCGKTTLLRQLKPALAPHGERTGAIYFAGERLDLLPEQRQASEIGFVLQSPENQIVTDKVWHELAFGLESLGLPNDTIRRRVAEMASFFGISDWFDRRTCELSGGQKQLLSLASVMVMQPRILILDEPTSQLDPIAASDFLETVARLNRELGTTVVLTEHRLEEALPLSDRVALLDEGRLLTVGSPAEVGGYVSERRHPMFRAMPAPVRVFAGLRGEGRCPVTVREGRDFLSRYAQGRPPLALPPERRRAETPSAVELTELFFRYERELPDVIKGLSLTVREGELFALVGGNGTGKSTLLSLIAGLGRPQRGAVTLFGGTRAKVGYLPQDPRALFVKKTVELDLLEMTGSRKELERVAELCEISHLLRLHPYDLSGGEQQRAALAKVLLTRPRLLLLDEPTKGMDADFKERLAALLRKLREGGTTILLVSHDVEFCAEVADRCALLFDGAVAACGTPRSFFAGNNFYTTAANRMARELLPEAVTVPELILAFGGKEQICSAPERTPLPAAEQVQVSRVRRSAAWMLLAAAVLLALCLMGGGERLFGGDLLSGALPLSGKLLYLGAAVLLCAAVVCALFLLRGPRREERQMRRERLSKRTVAASAFCLLLVPFTIYIGIHFLGDRKYYFISLLVLLETMAPFALCFEGRRPKPRELLVIAVLCAVAVAGRTAFFWLPQFKPVAAVVIVAGMAFGGEAGFLVGAMSAFVSNFFFGQGPWTPWQMFAFGLIGFLAGVLARRGLLPRRRWPLAVFGFLSTVVIYGGILNPASVLIFQGSPTPEMMAASYLTGLPFDLVHGTATFFFLMVGGQALLEKLDRVKIKYGLI